VGRHVGWIAAVTVMAAAAAFTLRPVCVPLSPEQLGAFTTPIETRADHDLYLRVFQQIDGRWYQCKTWLSRQLFF
jgi:hypothetical protein